MRLSLDQQDGQFASAYGMSGYILVITDIGNSRT
jgi:hypothetical protein